MYRIKTIREDGTESKAIHPRTQREADDLARSIYQRFADRGERCTVKLYKGDHLIRIVNRHTVERKGVAS
jgi:hypothetical protein